MMAIREEKENTRAFTDEKSLSSFYAGAEKNS